MFDSQSYEAAAPHRQDLNPGAGPWAPAVVIVRQSFDATGVCRSLALPWPLGLVDDEQGQIKSRLVRLSNSAPIGSLKLACHLPELQAEAFRASCAVSMSVRVDSPALGSSNGELTAEGEGFPVNGPSRDYFEMIRSFDETAQAGYPYSAMKTKWVRWLPVVRPAISSES